MNTPDKVEEILEEIQFIFNEILGYSPDGEIASLVTHGTAKMLKLRRTLTKYHQDLLQAIMDDVDLLHKRKELDDNGFCTIRDLLHSKALD